MILLQTNLHWWDCVNWQVVSSIAISSSFILTSITFFLSFRERRKKNDNDELNMYFKIKSDLSSKECKILMFSILEDNIHLESINGLDVLVRHEIDPQTNQQISKNLEIEYLHHLEDLYILQEKKLISYRTIYQGYSASIFKLWECPVIQQFVKNLRARDNDPELYSGVEKLYKLFKYNY